MVWRPRWWPCSLAGVADDAEILRGFEDAFELEGGVLLAALALVGGQGFLVGLAEGVVDLLADGVGADNDEARRLHEADGGSGVGGSEEAGEEVFGEGLLEEAAADVAALGDGAVDGVALRRSVAKAGAWSDMRVLR